MFDSERTHRGELRTAQGKNRVNPRRSWERLGNVEGSSSLGIGKVELSLDRFEGRDFALGGPYQNPVQGREPFVFGARMPGGNQFKLLKLISFLGKIPWAHRGSWKFLLGEMVTHHACVQCDSQLHGSRVALHESVKERIGRHLCTSAIRGVSQGGRASSRSSALRKFSVLI